jgi:hypothetical protein
MKDYAQKALTVLVEQVKAKDMIAYFSQKIGEGLAACLNENEDEYNHPYETHLSQAYAVFKDEYGTHYCDEEEKEAILKLCPHCLAAHNAVQERKKWKKKLATLRGTATKIGLAAHKQDIYYFNEVM